MVSPRTRTILGELERAESEFVGAQERHVGAQAEYDAAREKFIGIRRLASEALSSAEWYQWEEKHGGVKFVGMEIGDAVAHVLESHAYTSAFAHLDKPEENRYSPQMHVDRIIEALETGGVDFGSSTPKRVINAAVINKKNKVLRTGPSFYRIANADAILESAKEMNVKFAVKPVAKTIKPIIPVAFAVADAKSAETDDDVPF